MPIRFGGSVCVIMPNFVPIGQNTAKLWPFFSIFQDGGRTSSWICYTRAWDHLRKVVGSLYRRAKFGMNRQCGFENMQGSMLCEFGLKMLIHIPFGGVLR